MSLEMKYIKFQDLMSKLKEIIERESLYYPSNNQDSKELYGFEYRFQRNDSKYCNVIEKFEIHTFTPLLMIEMAIRNKDVIEITTKLDFINKLMNENQYLIKFLESNHVDFFANCPCEFDNNCTFEKHLTVLSKELQEKYKSISNLPLDKLQDEISNLLVDDVEIGYLNFSYLCFIVKCLQKRLKEEFFIFPDGYCKGEDLGLDQLVVSKENLRFIPNNLEYRKDELKKTLTIFRKFKVTDMKSIADLFFIYDYYKSRQNDGNYISEDIKLLLTIHHGIKIEGRNELISYTECLNNEKKYFDCKASFYMVEKSIRNKRKMMQNFIDECHYRYLIYN